MKAIRNSAKAIIIEEGRLLAIQNVDPNGEGWYILPGGGQQHGETLHEALQRECLEEIGTRVTIGDLRFIREYISKNHEFADVDGDVHQVEFMFVCRIEGDYAPTTGHAPDEYQTGVIWLPLAELSQRRIFPKALASALHPMKNTTTPAYMGDIN